MKHNEHQSWIDFIKANPRTRMGRCTCKHGQHKHSGVGPVFGHGSCMVEGCDCDKFTWSSYLKGVQLKAALEYAAEIDTKVGV